MEDPTTPEDAIDEVEQDVSEVVVDETAATALDAPEVETEPVAEAATPEPTIESDSPSEVAETPGEDKPFIPLSAKDVAPELRPQLTHLNRLGTQGLQAIAQQRKVYSSLDQIAENGAGWFAGVAQDWGLDVSSPAEVLPHVVNDYYAIHTDVDRALEFHRELTDGLRSAGLLPGSDDGDEFATPSQGNPEDDRVARLEQYLMQREQREEQLREQAAAQAEQNEANQVFAEVYQSTKYDKFTDEEWRTVVRLGKDNLNFMEVADRLHALGERYLASAVPPAPVVVPPSEVIAPEISTSGQPTVSAAPARKLENEEDRIARMREMRRTR